mmetsp:Transcript_69196/g.152737  ORF Transcript_69196/g.152737 Transcript_69196/m.152737 type:complete len:305 (-) Transcript_69196:130-1044(-)
MCSSIGVIAMTEPTDAYSRMLHEALVHLGERLDSLGADVLRIDSSLATLTEQAEKMPKPESACQEKGGRLPQKGAVGTPNSTASARGSVSKRIVALERGQRTLAAGTRRALRQALAAQRAVKESSVPVVATSHESWEFPCWLDNFLQQEFHQLDGQVSKLSTSLQREAREAFPPENSRPAPRSSYPTSLHSMRSDHNRPAIPREGVTIPVQEARTATRCVQEPQCRPPSWTDASGGAQGAQAPQAPQAPQAAGDRDQTLVEMMEEAVEEAEMEQLHKAAREEAERLRKELSRVQKLSARTKNKR